MLVSCVMPTYNRRGFIPAAIDCFLKQTYEPRELVILDNGNDRVMDLIPNDCRIRYIEAPAGKLKTGTLRNMVNEEARGDVIAHWDDDDYSVPDRISDQVACLEESGKPMTGYSSLLFWDTLSKQAKIYRSEVKGYVCGTSFCYLKSFWIGHPFRDQQEASDNAFVYPIISQVEASHDMSHMVARIHAKHTSNKSAIGNVIDKSVIPSGFWENEELRIRRNGNGTK